MTTPEADLNQIRRQIMWTRLIAVVEEQAKALMRTAFSETVSEAGDLSAGVFDRQGRMIAQAITGTAGHVNSMAEAVPHFLAKFPVTRMVEGDHFITNDPWLVSGHLHDVTVVSPAFYRGQVVALFACTCHQVDIGGRGQGIDARSVYEEGLFLPVMALARAGQLNRDLLEIIRENVRQPDAVEGDILSYITANEVGGRKLGQLLDEFPEIDFAGLADFIIRRSQAAVVAEIGRWPQGTYRHHMTLDGIDSPIELVVSLTIAAERILVDYAGSAPASPYGINLVLNYTKAYSAFGVRTAIGPAVPNNSGSLAPIVISAPAGSILNVPRPAPVAARHIIGLFLPDLVLGCLAQARPDQLPAESASVWGIQLRGGPEATRHFGRPDDPRAAPAFDILLFNSGGAGARPAQDGLSATAFPSGIKTVPVEIAETAAPIVIWRKELRPDSGGAGRWRGGLGQSVEVNPAGDAPFAVFAMWDRVANPARGRAGGRPGAPLRPSLAAGQPIQAKGKQFIAPANRLCLDFPGGGGFGDPLDRDLARVAHDVAEGLVSREAALALYGVVIGEDGAVDRPASAAERARRQRRDPDD
jgi:N-methylhydantoinase B/oxoprolinase/acetone carboxylase alpha subunit